MLKLKNQCFYDVIGFTAYLTSTAQMYHNILNFFILLNI